MRTRTRTQTHTHGGHKTPSCLDVVGGQCAEFCRLWCSLVTAAILWPFLVYSSYDSGSIVSLSLEQIPGSSGSSLNMNLYATKKTVAEGMLDVALFLANVTHMKTVIEQGAGYR